MFAQRRPCRSQLLVELEIHDSKTRRKTLRSLSAAPDKLLRRGRFDLSLGASPSLAMLLRRGRGEDETEIPLSDHAKHTIVLSVSSP
jgi:hypothetical protein